MKMKHLRITWSRYLLYQRASIAILLGGLLAFLLGAGVTIAYFTAELILLVDILQMAAVTLVLHVRKAGLRSISLHGIWQSIRFKITLWYTIILALILIVFSSLVINTTLDSLIASLDTSVQHQLAQVGSTYNAQTGRIVLPANTEVETTTSKQVQNTQLAPGPKIQPQNGQGTSAQNQQAQPQRIHVVSVNTPLPQNISVLLTPEGQVLQASLGIKLDSYDGLQFQQWLRDIYTPHKQPKPAPYFAQSSTQNMNNSTNSAQLKAIRATPGAEKGTTSARWNNTPLYLGYDASYIETLSDTHLQLYDLNVITFYTLKGNQYRLKAGAIADQQGKVTALLVVGQYADFSWQHTLTQVENFAIPLTVLLASIGGYWLAGWSMRPVQKITSSVRQITATDLHRRLHIKQKDELGDLAGTFDEMLDRLETAFERQRQFTADASHELRTPLSIVDLEATRALNQDYTPQQYWQAMKIIQQENQHMARLVDDLLTLARTDSGQYHLRQEEVDLGDLVLEIVGRLLSLASETGIAVHVSPCDDAHVAGDPIALGRVLTNLIENALKYSASSGSRVDIELDTCQRQDTAWARLTITDDGPGIAPEHIPHLFERFYRIDAARTRHATPHTAGTEHTSTKVNPNIYATSDKTIHQTNSTSVDDLMDTDPGGSGLGLSIARWITQAHGGDIHVYSQPEHGTTFEVWLPLTEGTSRSYKHYE